MESVINKVAILLSSLIISLSYVDAISDTWAIVDVLGRVDSDGSLAFWRDLAITGEFPDPSDDFDRVIVKIEEFLLILPDRNRIDLLQPSNSDHGGIFQPSSCDLHFNGLSGTGKSLKVEALGDHLSVFLYIFSSHGSILLDSSLRADIRPEDALIGLEIPNLVDSSEFYDLCSSKRCRLQVSLGIEGQLVTKNSRNREVKGNWVIFDLQMGQNTRVTLSNKILVNYTGEPAPLHIHDVTLGLATISQSAIGVTVTAPYIPDDQVYLMTVKPGMTPQGKVIPETREPASGQGSMEDAEEDEEEEAEEAKEVAEELKNPPENKHELDENIVSDNEEDYQQTENVDTLHYADQIDPKPEVTPSRSEDVKTGASRERTIDSEQATSNSSTRWRCSALWTACVIALFASL